MKHVKRENAKATKCGRGHKMAGDNLGYRKSGPLEGHRYCKACVYERVKARREMLKARKAA